MARLPRIVIAGHAHHVLQRGHDGGPIVRDDEDRRQWLALLRDTVASQRVSLHAWVLLDDHFHLVATPPEAQALGRMVQSLTRRHAAAFNRRHARRGTLWEGRYRASLVQPGAWLADALVYVEQHPARAGLVAAAADWPWSSAQHHLGMVRDPAIGEAAAWWGLGNTPFEREATWQRRLAEGLDARAVLRITTATRRGWPIGEPDFLAALQATAPQRLVPRPRGRPPRSAA
jgi:putative transposase